MDARQLYRAGRLNEAIDAMNGEVRKKPADIVARGFLAELLAIVGNFDRADAQLEIVTNQSPEAGVGVSLIRQLLRAAKSRQEFFSEGRVPEVLADPTEEIRLRIEASLMSREGDDARAADLLAQAEEARPAAKGTIDGKAFDDMRDLDDLVGGMFEVLTSTGKYYWIPMNTVQRLAPRKPERPLDLLWIPAEMNVENGPDGVVYIPSTYASHEPTEDEQLMLGRATEWVEKPGDVVRGAGLRGFLVGEEDPTVLQLGEILFEQAPSS